MPSFKLKLADGTFLLRLRNNFIQDKFKKNIVHIITNIFSKKLIKSPVMEIVEKKIFF